MLTKANLGCKTSVAQPNGSGSILDQVSKDRANLVFTSPVEMYLMLVEGVADPAKRGDGGHWVLVVP